MPSPATPLRLSATGVDLSPRVQRTATVAASPAAGTETIIASLTISGNLATGLGIVLFGWCAVTAGTNAIGGQLQIRKTDASGSVLADSGAVTVVATKLYAPTIFGVDTAPSLPGQVYVLTLTMASGSAESTVSAAQLLAIVV